MNIGKFTFFEKTNSPDIINIIVKRKYSDAILEWRYILQYASPNWRNLPTGGRKGFIVWHHSYKAIKIPFLGELIFQTQ